MSDNEMARVELTVPSGLDFLSLVDAVSTEVTGDLGIDDETRFAICNSVVEAATNAIEHGNGLDIRKRVSIHYLSWKDRIEIKVTDEGNGFDLDKVEDPRKPENLMRERGRGIFILRQFMDEVYFHIEPSKGTTVHMIKSLTAR